MKCDAPVTIRLDKPKPDYRGGLIYSIPVPCGKCLLCKKRRVNQWSVRLMKELEVSDSALFVTLTYNTYNVPITENRFMSLKKKDLKDFFKRLRYHEENAEYKTAENYQKIQRGWKPNFKRIRYYGVGEYGTRKKRPHYHIILFNVIDENNISKAWAKAIGNGKETEYVSMGDVHIDVVNNNTIDYTLKYINKGSQGHKFKAFDGEKEFSVHSKGLGANLITSEIARYYKRNLDVNYIMSDKGYKVAMPKYFRDRILDKGEKDKQIGIIKRAVEKETAEKEAVILKRGGNVEEERLKKVLARQVILNRVISRDKV